MTTDASSKAWGAWIPGHEVQGFWDKGMFYRHSNYRKLSAMWLGLISLCEFLQNKTVQIFSDNITTVAFINHMGGSTKELDMVARQIHQQAMKLNINTKIVASYISGVKNWQADQLGRLKSTYEWKLHPNLFRLIDSYWGPHNIDRFASMMTAQIPNYNSLYWGPLTSVVKNVSAEGLVIFEQLRKCFIQFTSQSPGHSSTTTGNCHHHSSYMANSNMVPKDESTPNRQCNSSTKFTENSALNRSTRGTAKNKGWRLYAWRVSGGRVSDA